jgi:hypothetical protein
MTINEAIIYAEEMAATDGNRKRQDNYNQIAEWLKDYKRMLQQEPCEDCISRQAVLEAIDVKAWEFCDYLISKNRNDEQKPVSHFADNLRECVRETLPPVTPQPKTGHWIICLTNADTFHHCECSECSSWAGEVTDYCPHCGARMVEPQESEDVG